MNVRHYCIAETLADQSWTVTSNKLEVLVLRKFMKKGESLPPAGQPAGVPV